MVIDNIIFDWSGTLSDDFKQVYQASMLVFKNLDREKITEEEYRREFILPYMKFWNKYFPELTKSECDKLYGEAINQVDEPKLYLKVKDEIEKFHSRSINMIVISSHPHEKLIKEANNYDIKNFFKEINGSIHDKTEKILEIIKRNNFDYRKTMYVGDMTHDIEAGRKAGVITVGICWGYQPKEVLMGSNPNYSIENISDLEELLK